MVVTTCRSRNRYDVPSMYCHTNGYIITNTHEHNNIHEISDVVNNGKATNYIADINFENVIWLRKSLYEILYALAFKSFKKVYSML